MWKIFKKPEPKYKVNDYVQFVCKYDFIYCGTIWKVESSRFKGIQYHINHPEFESIMVGKNYIVPECNIIKKVCK